jgi:hypothetical protein
VVANLGLEHSAAINEVEMFGVNFASGHFGIKILRLATRDHLLFAHFFVFLLLSIFETPRLPLVDQPPGAGGGAQPPGHRQADGRPDDEYPSLGLWVATAAMGWGRAVHRQPDAACPYRDFGTGRSGFFEFDRASETAPGLRDVCSACHSMTCCYRPGGDRFHRGRVKKSQPPSKVTDRPDEQRHVQPSGKPFDRFKALPTSRPRRQQWRPAADLTLIAKSRAGKASTYDGADYIHSLLVGYEEAPADFALGEGMTYNKTFKGNQIAMPQPLTDDAIVYADGTPATLDQLSKDTAVFLTWAAETELEARHRAASRH